MGKVSLFQSARHSTRVICGLRAGGRVDRATVNLAATGSASATTANLMLSREFGAPGRASIRCRYYLSAGQSGARVKAAWNVRHGEAEVVQALPAASLPLGSTNTLAVGQPAVITVSWLGGEVLPAAS